MEATGCWNTEVRQALGTSIDEPTKSAREMTHGRIVKVCFDTINPVLFTTNLIGPNPWWLISHGPQQQQSGN